MKKVQALCVIAVTLLLMSCQKPEKKETSTASSPPASDGERTYEERRDEAALKIKKHKEGVVESKVRVDLSSLTGRKLSSLYAQYLGINPGPVPPFTNVSFDERMASMYHQKVFFKKCKKKKPDECIVSSDTVLSQAPELLERYIDSNKMKMDLKRLIAIADEKVVLAKKHIDWAMLCKSAAYRLDAKKCKLLQEIVANINGKDLVAYGMTELLPSPDGDLNVLYMDVLLRNAGAQFLYHVPALGDRYASLGLYQVTFFSLRKDEMKVAGTNVVSSMVRNGGEKIPDSVVHLSSHQHHTAAFYFAVHNIAEFLNRASTKQVATLAKIHQKHLDEMVILVACAHHHPGLTYPVIKKWLDMKGAPQSTSNRKKKEITEVDIVPMFPLKADLRMYAKKSRNNLAAVYALYKE